MNSVVGRLAWRLSRLAPIFHVRPEQISFLASPTQYYEFLKESIASATRKIYLSSLYIGTDELERRLIQMLGEQLALRGSSLEAHVHLDYFRGSRGHPNSSASLLLSLLAEHSSMLRVSMFRCSRHWGWQSVLPSRWNEMFGLSHMKVCVFDDTVLVTGANLSKSYFTNRADRYVCIRNHPELASFFVDLMRTVGDISCRLTLSNSNALTVLPPVVAMSDSSTHLHQFIDRHAHAHGHDSREQGSTIVIPTLQMAPCGVRQDEGTLKELFRWMDDNHPTVQPTFSTGYFNLAPASLHTLFATRNIKQPWRILISSPEANGFFGAKGPAGHIPHLYRALELEFLQQTNRARLPVNERGEEAVYEYRREGWTFHAKGIWLDSSDLMVAVAGSSNFGHRSFERDLEAQLTIVTDDPTLMQRIRTDRESFFAHARLVSAQDITRSDAPSMCSKGAAVLFRPFL